MSRKSKSLSCRSINKINNIGKNKLYLLTPSTEKVIPIISKGKFLIFVARLTTLTKNNRLQTPTLSLRQQYYRITPTNLKQFQYNSTKNVRPHHQKQSNTS
jgi:hypothetical protein